MIRRISTKWVLTVLVAVVVPFVGFAYFVNKTVSDRLSGDVVRMHLLSLAADLTDQIDSEIEERRLDAELLALDQVVEWAVTGDDDENDERLFLDLAGDAFDHLVQLTQAYDLVLAVDAEGSLVATNVFDASGRSLPPEQIRRLHSEDFSQQAWFRQAMESGFAVMDWHRSPLVTRPDEDVDGSLEGARLPDPGDYHIGFVCRIETSDGSGRNVGVVMLLMNWSSLQELVTSYGTGRLRELADGGGDERQLVGDIYKSSYAWIWKSDADTIIAHPRRHLYGAKVSGPLVDLPQLVDRAASAEWGMYPTYTFKGVPKRAAFKWCKGPELGHFGWVVGVGVDDADIYAPVVGLSRLLYLATAVVLAFVVAWTVFFAHRTTRPILDLQQHTRRIASGDLDARIEVDATDELGDLADSFNRMTTELKQNREQLVKAEKDAAWREMARQVAHEIKNPLTPISLSASLLKRSREENSPEFDAILDRTIDLIQRQVVNMREIARDFYAFAGEHRELESLDLGAVVDEVLDLNAAWAQSQAVEIRRMGDGGRVKGDPEEIKRALINVVSNALEAMPDGGELFVTVEASESEVAVEIRDTGSGLATDVEQHLFEPYFTTRSSGTGLGLAIVRRVVEDMGGRVELRNAPAGSTDSCPTGAVARIVLPREA